MLIVDKKKSNFLLIYPGIAVFILYVTNPILAKALIAV